MFSSPSVHYGDFHHRLRSGATLSCVGRHSCLLETASPANLDFHFPNLSGLSDHFKTGQLLPRTPSLFAHARALLLVFIQIRGANVRSELASGAGGFADDEFRGEGDFRNKG